MKLYLDCIPCFQRQALFATRNMDDKLRSEVLRKVIKLLYYTSWNTSPDVLSQKIYDIIKKETGIEDPYRELKKKSNIEALEYYPLLKNKLQDVNNKKDRLYTAAKLAIAGNIIDFGPQIKFDIQKTITEVLDRHPGIDEFDLVYQKIHSADSLLYFADNAGEIVFDKIFIEEMIAVRNRPFERISFVVKGVPIINDAMQSDVIETGIDLLPGIEFMKLGNGDNETGPIRRDKEVRKWIEEHDLVISKGQGNFEGFSNYKGVCFLLIAKCPIIADELKVEELDAVIKCNQ